MTNPRDDLMALATNHTEVLWRKAQEARMTRNNGLAEQYADEARQWEDAIRAASRPAPQVVDMEAVALFQAVSDGYPGKIEHGYLIVENPDASPAAIALGGADPNLAISADAILSLLRPADLVEPPGMTDLMVTPESLDAFMEANPLPDKPTTTDDVGEPVAASPYEGKMIVDAKLLHALWCYGNLHVVEGVIYSPGSHQECLAQVNALFRERAAHPPAQPDTSAAVLPTCCVTGAIPGDGGACGDCDPCILGEAKVPDVVKRLIAEKNNALQRAGEAEDAVLAERERCAAVCERIANEIMERAEAAHEEEDYDGYERLECAASEYSHAAAAIRQLPTSERGDK